MKVFFTFLFLVLLVSCNESGVQLAKPSTFVRYFNGGFNDQAETVIETSDKGLLILANTLTKTTISNNYYKVKLIKTDQFGNQVWEHFYPEFPADQTIHVDSYRGFGLTAIQDDSGNDVGYVIAGEQINGTTHRMLMIKVDTKGAPQMSPRTFDFNGLDVQGVSVAWSKSTAHYFVLGQNVSSVQSSTASMIFAEVKDTIENSLPTVDLVWSKSFGDGKSTLANRLFLSFDEKSAYWGGTVSYSGLGTQIRYVNSGFNSSIAVFNLPIGNSLAYNVEGEDICQYGYGYGFVGGLSALGDNKYDSITYTQVSSGGFVTRSINFPIVRNPDKPTNSPQSTEPANSICSTQDGGVLILGTIALDDQGTNTDYYLIKVDAIGSKTPQWTRHFGSKFIDVGAKVIQASDGGYIVLGTTNLANVQSICLVKTDLQGNVQ